MKRDILILSALCTCCNLFAEEITVKYLRYAGPYEIKGPFIVDSLDVNSKKFTDAELLKTAIPFNNVRKSNRTLDAATTAGQSKNSSVSLASFYLNSDRYTDGTLQISGQSITKYISTTRNRHPPTASSSSHSNPAATKS